MPYVRPGKIVYINAGATKAVNHGNPVTELNFVGTAIKQGVPPFGTGPAFSSPGVPNATLIQVGVGEKFAIETKGVVQVPVTGISSPAVGDAVYIVAADNSLTKTASGNLKFGRIVELAGTRQTPTGFCRIDLDHKASF